MEWLVKAKKSIQSLTFYVCAASMLLLIPMMLLTTADVIGRASLARPIPGVVELSEYMLAVLILLGLAYTQQVKGHPRVTFILSRLPPRTRSIVEIVTALLCLFIVAIIVWQGWVVALHESAYSDMLRIPQLPFRLLVPVGAFFLSLELFIDLTASAEKLIRKKP